MVHKMDFIVHATKELAGILFFSNPESPIASCCKLITSVLFIYREPNKSKLNNNYDAFSLLYGFSTFPFF